MILAISVLAANLAGATAQNSPPATAHSSESSPADAEQLFHEGLKAYDEHAYVRALRLFERAYVLSQLPEIQFDIAQAYRALGDCRKAEEHFDAFLNSVPPDDPLAARARSRRQQLSACAGEPAVADSAPTEPIASRTAPAVRLDLAVPDRVRGHIPGLVVSEKPRSERTLSKLACAGAVGAAVAAGLAGGLFELQAKSTEESVALVETWDTAAQRADERGQTLAQTGEVLLLSAGILAAGAMAMCWVGWSGRSSP